MNKLLITAAGLTLSMVTVAGAADLPPVYRAPPVAAPPVYTWTGCYLGGGFGYGVVTQDLQAYDTAGLAAGTRNTNGARGWAGTVQVGCDYQFGGSFVIGAFGDYDWTNYRGDGVFSAAALVPGDVRGSQNMTSAWAAGGRVGWVPAALPQLLVYVSGGWTQARFDRVNLFFGFTGASAGVYLDRHTYGGYFLGSGYEYALGWFPGLSWKTEYRWSDFGSARLPELANATGLPNGFSKDSRVYVQTVRSELVWRFNPGR